MTPRFFSRPGARLAIAALSASGALVADQPNLPAAAPLPAGYKLVHEQHFDSADALRSFAMTDPAAWKFSADGNSRALELAQQSRYEPAFRSPLNITLIADRVFGDFVLEADLIQTGKEYGHRDMCLFFGVQDPSHFYYAHIATKGDDHAHNVFAVDGAPRLKFASRTTTGADWGLGVWHHVRLERRAVDGTVKVYFDDMNKPILTAVDRTLSHGWIGIGSFDDLGEFRNLEIAGEGR